MVKFQLYAGHYAMARRRAAAIDMETCPPLFRFVFFCRLACDYWSVSVRMVLELRSERLYRARHFWSAHTKAMLSIMRIVADAHTPDRPTPT